jgi:hypothetical protein
MSGDSVGHIGGEMVSAVVSVGGGIGLSGLVRAWIRHRTRVHVERERSARTAARAAGLARLARRHETVLIDEKDQDGHRVVQMHSPARNSWEEAA